MVLDLKLFGDSSTPMTHPCVRQLSKSEALSAG